MTQPAIDKAPAAPAKGTRIALWILQAVAAFAFLGAGGAKLAGSEPMVQLFRAVGVGQWFRYVTGAIEVGSAVLLWVPGLGAVGALLLACTMAGAILTHFFILHTPPTGPVFLLALVLAIAWLRRRQISALLGRSAKGA